MNNKTSLIDLAQKKQKIRFDAVEDRAAFGVCRSYRSLFKNQVYKVKQNDPNFCMLDARECGTLTVDVCDRIGFYLWRNLHMKNISLQRCGLSEEKMKKLFSRMVDQHDQNESNSYLEKHDILEKILNVGDTSLTGHVMSYLALTPFARLLHIDLSDNTFGTKGLDVLVKAIAGSPVEEIHLECCAINDLSPLILGGRKLKQLKVLDMNCNMLDSTAENAMALSVLFDGGYPRQRELCLQRCGIDSDLIVKSAPVLSSNRNLRFLHLYDNPIRDKGTAALIAAICDSTSFEKMLTSNHTVLKIMVGETRISNLVSVLQKKLQRLSFINLMMSFRGPRGTGEVACRKLFTLLAYDDDIDPSMFLHFDIGLAPQILSKFMNSTDRLKLGESLTATYKILKCKLFRQRLELSSQTKKLQIDHDALKKREEETRMKNEQLESDNAALSEENRKLKEQIALLMSQSSADLKTNHSEAEQNVGSIAQRVKTRAKRRKRGEK